MTFNPTMRFVVNRTVKKLPRPAKVIEFGNQRFTAGHDFPSTQKFYESLGFDYTALDVNENMGAIIADLNEPIDLPPVELVTNNGTSEHIFDQRSCFENAHRLCKVDGYMIHVLPFHPWINHGFFNYNPILFRDLAIANGYKTDLFAIGDRNARLKEMGEEAFIEKRPEQLIKTLNKVLQSGEAFVIAVFKKVKDAEFCLPFQGKYKTDIRAKELEAKYVQP